MRGHFIILISGLLIGSWLILHDPDVQKLFSFNVLSWSLKVFQIFKIAFKSYDLSKWHGLYGLFVCPNQPDDDIHSDYSYLDTLEIPINSTLKHRSMEFSTYSGAQSKNCIPIQNSLMTCNIWGTVYGSHRGSPFCIGVKCATKLHL